MDAIRFGRDDLDVFSAASFDRNPLHMSDRYARRTAYGEPVVFGILGVLASLGALPEHRARPLRGVSLLCRNALFTGVDYRARVELEGADQARVTLEDGGRSMMRTTFTFAPAGESIAGAARDVAGAAPVAEPVRYDDGEIREGFTVGGTYSPSPAPFRELLGRWTLPATSETVPRLAALLWSSYLVGMQLPGERGIFSQLRLDFRDSPPGLALPMAYEARVARFEERFSLLQIASGLSCGGVALADAEIRAFLRADPAPLRIDEIVAALPPSERLRGKTAMVIGGSRGLGAALVAALASQGCDVLLNYRASREDAEALAAASRGATGTVTLAQGDASDEAWCRQWRAAVADRGGLDLLICSAIPPIRTLGFALDSVARLRKYVDDSLALVGTPLAAFRDQLEERGGMGVVISSVVASEASSDYPPDWHHYVAAKAAVEGLVRSVAAQSQRAHFLVVRPARLLTDQTNTPTGRQGARPVEGVAAAIVGRVLGPRGAARLEVLDDFDAGPVVP